MSEEFPNGHEKKTEIPTLGSLAYGSIDPSDRVRSGKLLDERIDRAVDDIDAHYVWIGDSLVDVSALIPRWCVDGREDPDNMPIAPNAAGGTYTLVIGAALIDAPQLLGSVNTNTSARHGKTLFGDLKSDGYDIGGHVDDHSPEDMCGCGACDRQKEIIEFIANNIDDISDVAASLGVPVPTNLRETIKANATLLIEQDYISTGNEMIESIETVGGGDSVQKLHGGHKEVALAINKTVGSSIDRKSFAKKHGNDLQVFNVDVWAIENGIRAITQSEEEYAKKFAGAILYNLATAYVLAGPSLRVVVR